MKLYSSYNKKDGRKNSGKKYEQIRGKSLLGISLAVFVLLFLIEGRRFSDRAGDPEEMTGHSAEETDFIEAAQITDREGTLEVHFLDVGHGDSTLIMCGEHAMMIDCGDAAQGIKLQDYLTDHGVTELDYLVLTHPDKDHIGGAPDILTKFPTRQVFRSGYDKESQTEERLQQTMEYERIESVAPAVGTEYQLGEAWFVVLAPNGEYEESNDSSIALLLHFGENTFLFTGDAEKKAENDMMENSGKPGLSLKADVYQVGHHGDKSSSKKKFLKAVSPAYAVISCDLQGEKGHPHAEVLERLREAGVMVFRTDEQGTVVAVSDGKDITWNCMPSETWQAGEPGEN